MLWTIIVSILTSSVVTLVVEHFVKSSIAHYFDKKIKIFENDLSAKSDLAKFDYQRKIQDFSLYTTNKHKSYIELYEALLKAHGLVTNLSGVIVEIPTFEEYNEHDIQKYLSDRNIPEGKVLEVLAIWPKDRESAIKEITKYDLLHKHTKAKNILNEAQNIFWKSQLYFSDAVVQKVQTILDKLRKIQIIEDMAFFEKIYDRDQKTFKIKDELSPLLTDLIKDMKSELSIGYYK